MFLHFRQYKCDIEWRAPKKDKKISKEMKCVLCFEIFEICMHNNTIINTLPGIIDDRIFSDLYCVLCVLWLHLFHAPSFLRRSLMLPTLWNIIINTDHAARDQIQIKNNSKAMENASMLCKLKGKCSARKCNHRETFYNFVIIFDLFDYRCFRTEHNNETKNNEY